MTQHEYKATDLEPFDCVAHIRKRRKMFFHVDGIGSVGDLLSRLADDPRLLGANSVVTESHDDWHIVCADVDWLPDQERDGYSKRNHAFDTTTPFKTEFENSFHYVVFVTALAERAVTVSQKSRHVIAGTVSQSHPIWKQALPKGMARSVAFTIDAARFGD